MIDVRNLLTAIVIGACLALLVRELNQYGLLLTEWNLGAPRTGEAVVTGGLVGAVSQLLGQVRRRRR